MFEFRCNSCKTIHKRECADLEWECVESIEREMGPDKHYVSRYDEVCNICNNAISIEFGCWEYPVGALNLRDEPEVMGAVLLSGNCSIDFENEL